jgi:hypothetical protein
MRTWMLALLVIGGPAVADEWYVVPDGIETRWASPENPRGERGQGDRRMVGARARRSSHWQPVNRARSPR